MIVLLTSLPGTGKTTVLDKFLKKYSGDCFWILSKEIRNNKGERVGFEAVTSDGRRETFAHKELIKSENLVGSYQVDLAVIDRLFSEPILQELKGAKRLLVIDEIGRMEMLSKKFVNTIDMLFDADTPVLATIRHGDDWAEKYKNYRNVKVLELTEGNRDHLPDTLVEIFKDIK